MYQAWRIYKDVKSSIYLITQQSQLFLKIKNANKICYDNIIEHPITRQQTQQQKRDKNLLYLQTQKQQIKNINQRGGIDLNIGNKRKEDQLRGQLQQTGVGFFLRQRSNDQGKCLQCIKNKHIKLIPTDCKFNHTCHGGIGMMNQHCKHSNRHFDALLKEKYDFKYNNSLNNGDKGPIYVFKQRNKKKTSKI